MIGVHMLAPDDVNTRHNKTGRHLSTVVPPAFFEYRFYFSTNGASACATAGILVLQLPFCNIEVNHAFSFQI